MIKSTDSVLMDVSSGACAVCQSISSAIDVSYPLPGNKWVDQYEKPTFSLGSMEEIQDRVTCTSCQGIAKSLDEDAADWTGPIYVGLEHDEICIFEETPFEGKELCLVPLGGPFSYDGECGRQYDTERIDIDLIKTWSACCQGSHVNDCLSPALPPPPHKIYLVDVEQGCLVLATTILRYIALSYVWGNAPTTKTTLANLSAMMQPGSIDAGANSLLLPNTIRDALRLTSLLKTRYLWVDTLCIVQDDQDTKQLHFNSMASIYANAYLTVVAAGGEDANYGLRGIEGAEPRATAPEIVRFPGRKDMLVYGLMSWRPEDSIWAKRGWTFQEALFSRRILVFNGLISWFCRAAHWQEFLRSPTEYSERANQFSADPSLYLPSRYAARLPRWPDLETWSNHLKEFNDRQLTYDEDAIDAFAGVTSVFQPLFDGGILWGIPEMFFDTCIIWQPIGALRRRGAHGAVLGENPFPSWSWVGWEGETIIGSGYELPFILQIGQIPPNNLIKITPWVRWHKSMTVTSEVKPVKTIDYSPQIPRYPARDHLPPGWSHVEDVVPYYRNDSFPSVRFPYLIPLSYLHRARNDSVTDNTYRYLRFSTQRTWLSMSQTRRVRSDYYVTTLVDKNGAWAGCIRLTFSQYDTLPRSLPLTYEEPCELIALSLGRALNDAERDRTVLDEWQLSERPSDSEFYDFIHVMWIEWEDGIAYRKAVGTVYEAMWDSLVREDIDVILG